MNKVWSNSTQLNKIKNLSKNNPKNSIISSNPTSQSRTIVINKCHINKKLKRSPKSKQKPVKTHLIIALSICIPLNLNTKSSPKIIKTKLLKVHRNQYKTKILPFRKTYQKTIQSLKNPLLIQTYSNLLQDKKSAK